MRDDRMRPASTAGRTAAAMQVSYQNVAAQKFACGNETQGGHAAQRTNTARRAAV